MRLRHWVRAIDLRDDHGRLVAVTLHRFRHTVATRMISTTAFPRSPSSSCSITSHRT
jgi:integrase